MQPSYYVKQELERIEKPAASLERQSYSPMRRSRSPKRGPSNSPSRVAAALKDSQGVGVGQSGAAAAYMMNRSPLDISATRGVSGSPLR